MMRYMFQNKAKTKTDHKFRDFINLMYDKYMYQNKQISIIFALSENLNHL